MVQHIIKPQVDVTILVGNGYDLALGIPTKWSDFKGWLDITSQLMNNRLVEFLNSRDNLNDWNDVEAALPSFQKNISNDLEAMEALDEFSDVFEKYLSKLNQMVENFLPRLYDETSFEKGVLELMELCENVVDPETDNINITFLNFNYTHTLDMLLKKSTNISDNVVTFRNHSNWTVQTWSVDNLEYSIHVHGAINDEFDQICIGIDSEKDFFGSGYPGNRVKQRFIKSNMLSYTNNVERYVNAKRRLSTADAIIIFGLSMGNSDRTWTHQIQNRMGLSGGKVRPLFIAYGNPVRFKRKHSQLIIRTQEIQDKFISSQTRDDRLSIIFDDAIWQVKGKQSRYFVNSILRASGN